MVVFYNENMEKYACQNKVKSAKDFVRVGEKLKVKVIDIDDHGKVKLSHKEFVEKVKKEQPAPQPEVKIEEAKSDSEEKPVEEKKKKGLFRRK